MLQQHPRTANAALTLMNICAWAYALATTVHSIA
jgi:hypothetical protein